jgi:hypothetical protein
MTVFVAESCICVGANITIFPFPLYLSAQIKTSISSAQSVINISDPKAKGLIFSVAAETMFRYRDSTQSLLFTSAVCRARCSCGADAHGYAECVVEMLCSMCGLRVSYQTEGR